MSTLPVDASAHQAAPRAIAWGGTRLRSTLTFLSVPAVIAILIGLFDLRLPGWALYSFGLVFGLVLLVRITRDAEWLVAAAILYLPLARLYVVPMGPGLNGTNAVILMLTLALLLQRFRGEPSLRKLPNARLVMLWLAISLVSVITAGFTLSFGHVASEQPALIKRWLEPYIIFFLVLYLIRDGAMARRVVLYTMLGALLVVLLGFTEWLDRRHYDTIEKARVLGPQMQPNDFGAFLVYGAGPYIGLVVAYFHNWRTWLLAPYFLLMARVLLASFSRGAYLGLAVAGVAATYVRGKLFLAAVAAVALFVVSAFPQVVPRSMADRIGWHEVEVTGELDDSAQTRIVLWNAAIEMIKESPIMGKGFGTFQLLKSRYTEVDVREADNHNMFLYIASQMGLPALALFVWVLWRLFRQGERLYRVLPDRFGRAIGMGTCATVAGLVFVNMFGSRMVDLAVTCHFWILAAAVSHLVQEADLARAAARLRSVGNGLALAGVQR